MAASHFLCSNHVIPTSRNPFRSTHLPQFRPNGSSNFHTKLQFQRPQLVRAMVSNSNTSKKQEEVGIFGPLFLFCFGLKFQCGCLGWVLTFEFFVLYVLDWIFMFFIFVVLCCNCVLVKLDCLWPWWKDKQVGWSSGQGCSPFKAYFVLSLQGSQPICWLETIQTCLLVLKLLIHLL